MATSQITLDSGRQVTVHTPDGLDKEQTRAFLLKEGILPSTAGLSPFLPSEEGSASAAQAIALGRSLAPIADKVLSGMASLFGGFGFEPGVDVGGAGRPQLERDQPGATMVGEAIPFLAGGAGFRGASAFAGGFEALQPGATPGSVGRAMAIAGLGQQAGKFVGQGLGRLAAGGGRLAQRGVQGFRQTRPPTELPSGIQTTVGKLRGSKAIEQAEASAARNPFTSRPFNRIDRNNQAVGREKVLKWLDQADAPNLEEGVARAHADAIEAMDDAIPRDLEIKIPESVSRFFKKLQRTSERGAFDFPDNATVTGDDLRVIISDLRAGATSSRAATRRNSRKALELLDQEVLQKTEGINQELWREGSTGYGKWVKLTNGRAISKVDPEIINPTTVLKNLEKGNKAAVRTQGRVSTGDPELDDLIKTMTDWQQVGSLVPDSGTPTGLAIPLLVGDIATTGGVGTIGSFAGSELSQTAAGAGLLEGLLTAAPGAARAGAITGREASRQFGDLLFEQTAPEVAPEEEPE